jgi:NOL1/NOP2/fmu family ribosome biogenesis protein
MMRLLTSAERRYLVKRLEDQYGVEDAFDDLVLIRTGQGRIRAATKEAYEVACRLRRVQQVGLYVAKIVKGDVILSIEGSQLLGAAITKNIIELSEEEAEEWMKAAPIQRPERVERRYGVARCSDFYLGSGRISRDGRIYPQVAKWRRIPEE